MVDILIISSFLAVFAVLAKPLAKLIGPMIFFGIIGMIILRADSMGIIDPMIGDGIESLSSGIIGVCGSIFEMAKEQFLSI